MQVTRHAGERFQHVVAMRSLRIKHAGPEVDTDRFVAAQGRWRVGVTTLDFDPVHRETVWRTVSYQSWDGCGYLLPRPSGEFLPEPKQYLQRHVAGIQAICVFVPKTLGRRQKCSSEAWYLH